MANAKAKFYYTSSKYLDELPVENGNVIFAPDANMICLDMSNQRFTYETIKTFQTEQQRQDVPFPNEGFYYVEETNLIWRYNGIKWGRITPVDTDFIIYGDTEEDFPELGERNKLYYTDDGIYNWKDQLNKYNLIANANRWDSVQ